MAMMAAGAAGMVGATGKIGAVGLPMAKIPKATASHSFDG